MSHAIVRSCKIDALDQPELARARPLQVTAVHAAHADFVWTTLQRFGVRQADLEDMVQEVFVVVHRKLDTFDGTSRVTTWLFGICLRIATGYRRRAHIRKEQPFPKVPEPSEPSPDDPERTASIQQQRDTLYALLDELDLEKRAVFVMFEIDELPCDQIATMMGVPVGTVYSRLYAARSAFERALKRFRARTDRAEGRRA